MKILFISINGGLEGGANVALFNMMKELHKRNVEVILATGSRGALTDWMEQENLQYFLTYHPIFYTYPSHKTLGDMLYYPIELVKRLISNKINTKQVCKIIKQTNPDIVHTNVSPIYYGYLAAKKCGIAHVWHIREFLDIGLGMTFIPCNRILRQKWENSYTISISEEIAKHFERKRVGKDFVLIDGVMSEKEIIYNSQKKEYFLFVGRLSEQKGCNDLIEAYSKYISISSSETELWIAGVGNDDYEKSLHNLVKKRQLEDRVKFLGFRSDRYKLMSEAKALIVPSYNEGFGFITVEAIMNGCPVIGRYTAGTKLILDSVKGTEWSFTNIDELVQCMLELSKVNIQEIENRLLSAQEIARNLFSTESNCDNLMRIYTSILEKEK